MRTPTPIHKRWVFRNSKKQTYLIIPRVSRIKMILEKYVERTF